MDDFINKNELIIQDDMGCIPRNSGFSNGPLSFSFKVYIMVMLPSMKISCLELVHIWWTFHIYLSFLECELLTPWEHEGFQRLPSGELT